ncbi:MAG: D-glycero-beta-D-manno-heptose 1-phosphate adenylyltransferase [Ignavibacteria bacterium]|nr:D-glycero-beta-D-manno-heptose 1-phosphate adenylyltransferase [Ignavibacteria bacterium]
MIITSLDHLCDVRDELRRLNRVVVFTNGVFDILHAGHVIYLETARMFGDVLIVGINSDKSVRRIKGEARPINILFDRMTVLAALRAVDHVISFDEDTPIALIESLVPDVLVKGGDYMRDAVVGADIVEQHGGRVEIVPLVQGRSTTSIINRARKA